MTDFELYQRITRIEERAIARDAKIDDMSGKIDTIYDAFQQAKGAKYMVFGIAAAAGTLTSFLTKLIPFSNSLPR